jgi:hypothetical protein
MLYYVLLKIMYMINIREWIMLCLKARTFKSQGYRLSWRCCS